MTTCIAYGAVSADADLAPMTVERRELRADDVAIAIAYCGICHTDLHQARNDWGTTSYPCVPGHEIVGHVTALGRNATRFAIGDAVAVGCMVDSCQQCAACADDQEQQCLHRFTPTYNGKDRVTGELTHGGYSGQIVVRDRFVLKVPATLDLRYAAPLLCAGITAWTPLRRWQVGRGTRVGVIGLGGLGHMAVKLAAALGAEVTVITTSPGKAADAQSLGASHVLVSQEAAAMAAAAGTLDFVYDTIPRRHDVNPYLNLLGRRGVMVLVGAIEPLEPVHAGLLVRNDRALAGSMIGGIAATQEMLDFCGEHGILPVCEMIGMQEINQAFARLLANDVKYRFVIDMASLPRNEVAAAD
jgi:alcohol dehydrogenase (NADP+)